MLLGGGRLVVRGVSTPLFEANAPPFARQQDAGEHPVKLVYRILRRRVMWGIYPPQRQQTLCAITTPCLPLVLRKALTDKTLSVYNDHTDHHTGVCLVCYY